MNVAWTGPSIAKTVDLLGFVIVPKKNKYPASSHFVVKMYNVLSGKDVRREWQQ